MELSVAIYRIGLFSFPIQFFLLLAALTIGAALEFGQTFAWLLRMSLLAGLVAFCAGIALSVVSRRGRWLWLSGSSMVVALFSVLFGVAIGEFSLQ